MKCSPLVQHRKDLQLLATVSDALDALESVLLEVAGLKATVWVV